MDIPMLIRPDVRVEQPKLPILDQSIRVLQVGQPPSDRLDLGPGQNHPAFKFFQQEVVMRSDPINGSIPLSARGGVTAGRFFGIGLRLVSGLAWHLNES